MRSRGCKSKCTFNLARGVTVVMMFTSMLWLIFSLLPQMKSLSEFNLQLARDNEALKSQSKLYCDNDDLTKDEKKIDTQPQIEDDQTENRPNEAMGEAEMLEQKEDRTKKERELETETPTVVDKLIEIQENIKDSPPRTGKEPWIGAHVFYYPWYGNPETDDRYLHWDHEVLDNRPIKSRYSPPEQIGANFYPLLGCYSSSNDTLIHEHMKLIRRAGVGVVTVSWYPAAYSDGQIESNPGFSDANTKRLLTIAEKYDLKVNLHVEPYKGRSALSVAKDIRYAIDRYAHHAAFYREPRTGLPMFYVYDSYLIPQTQWAQVLGPPSQHPDSIRRTEYDAVVIGLATDLFTLHNHVPKAYFDGFYTYFATDGFTYGSSLTHWASMNSFAAQHDLLFIPSVGPGYVDTRIRPWNDVNTRDRRSGEYYDREWRTALDLSPLPQIVSITSWNEWHEGTQIEPAVPKTARSKDGVRDEYTYLDYAPHDPYYYVERTNYWIQRYAEHLTNKE